MAEVDLLFMVMRLTLRVMHVPRMQSFQIIGGFDLLGEKHIEDHPTDGRSRGVVFELWVSGYHKDHKTRKLVNDALRLHH